MGGGGGMGLNPAPPPSNEFEVLKCRHELQKKIVSFLEDTLCMCCAAKILPAINLRLFLDGSAPQEGIPWIMCIDMII